MKRLIAGMALLSLATSCGTEPLGSSRVEVLLTDAPATEASSLMVNFGRVDLVPADGSDEGVTTITDSAGEIDVLALRNGEVELLGEVDVPAGTYGQIRLIVEDAEVFFEEGDESFPVTIPSGAQTGLKINVEPALVAEAGETSQIVVDFDVARAVIETPPGSSNYLLKPTGVRAVTESGVLEGSVVDDADGVPLDGAGVTVFEEDTTSEVAGTATEDDGGFKIITLVEGTYDVEIDREGYDPRIVEDVVMTAGETNDLGTVGLTAQATTAQ